MRIGKYFFFRKIVPFRYKITSLSEEWLSGKVKGKVVLSNTNL
jgi:hypothetical protein